MARFAWYFGLSGSEKSFGLQKSRPIPLLICNRLSKVSITCLKKACVSYCFSMSPIFSHIHHPLTTQRLRNRSAIQPVAKEHMLNVSKVKAGEIVHCLCWKLCLPPAPLCYDHLLVRFAKLSKDDELDADQQYPVNRRQIYRDLGEESRL